MARKKESLLDFLVILPWWLNLIFAAAVYVLFKFVIPSIAFGNTFYKGMASALPSLAPLFALILCLTGGVSAFIAWRKRKLLDSQKGMESIRAVSWQEFELLVGEAYRRKGYHVAEFGGGGADGGIDLVLSRNGEKILVQCKQWRLYTVGVKTVRELFGLVAAEGASGGVLVSSGSFTQEAKDFAAGKPIELVDGPKLLTIIAEVQENLRVTVSQTDEVVCPLCGKKMVLRTATRGSHSGEQFWGCSAFPKCKGMIQP